MESIFRPKEGKELEDAIDEYVKKIKQKTKLEESIIECLVKAEYFYKHSISWNDSSTTYSGFKKIFTKFINESKENLFIYVTPHNTLEEIKKMIEENAKI